MLRDRNPLWDEQGVIDMSLTGVRNRTIDEQVGPSIDVPRRQSGAIGMVMPVALQPTQS